MQFLFIFFRSSKTLLRGAGCDLSLNSGRVSATASTTSVWPLTSTQAAVQLNQQREEKKWKAEPRITLKQTKKPTKTVC